MTQRQNEKNVPIIIMKRAYILLSYCELPCESFEAELTIVNISRN